MPRAPSAPVTIPPAPPAEIATPIVGAPDTDRASRQIEYNTTTIGRPFATSPGIAFSNHGGNRILPPRRDGAKNQLYTRDFQFHFDGRARQDIHPMVTDPGALPRPAIFATAN